MCARRFLIAVTILTLLAVAGAFAIFQFGGTVLREQFTPQGDFQPPPEGGAPDYADASLWIARPDFEPKNNPALWWPANWPPPTLEARHAAVFYVHPTTYLRGDRWNAPLFEPESGWRDRLFVQSQSSAFNSVAEIWAPRYRQAAYGSFLLNSSDARKALFVAYRDISAAFDHFLREVEPERPVILAGHSQGGLHLMRLIEERKADLKDRLIAAYVVGWPISVAADLPSLGFPVCRTAGQPGCILSWMSFADPPNPSLILSSWEKSEGPAGQKRRREDIVCVNPITGSFGGAAPPAANPGTLVPSADFTQATILPGAVGARCHDGLLILDGEVPPLGRYVLPGNNYHVYDFALFWGAIRRDAQQRLAEWQR